MRPMAEDIAEHDDALEAARDFVWELLPLAVAAHARECRRGNGDFVRIPIDIRTRLLEAPPGLVPALVEIVRSPPDEYEVEDDDLRVARAVDLLAVLGAREALPAIFELCVRDEDDHDTVVHDALACAIRDLNAVDEALAFGRSCESGLGALPFILSWPGLFDDMVLAWMVDMLPRDTANVALGLRCTDDSRIIPHVQRQLAELDPSRDDWADCVAELTSALEFFHKTLTPEEQALRDRALEIHRRAQELASVPVVEEPHPYSEATNPETSAERLEALSKHVTPEVRRAVANHPAAPAHVLARLVADIHPDVRWCAGRNDSLPRELIEQLARDPRVEARVSVAGNDGLPEHLRDLLWRDEDPEVRAVVLRHLPPSALAEAARDPDPQVRSALTIREDLPLEVIEQLAGDVDAQVRLDLIVDVHPPEHVLRRLLKDKDEAVRRAAAQRLPSGSGLRLIEPDPAPGADDSE
jgi:hypothetical protein